MLKKRVLVLAGVIGLLVLGTSVAYADEEQPPARQRAAGKVTSVDPSSDSFTLEMLRKGNLTVVVSGSTEFRSREGDIHGIEDLEVGMPVGVAGKLGSDGALLADVVVVGRPGGRLTRFRLRGEITGLEPSDGTFTLKTRAGEEIEIRVIERTRFLSRDDSIHGIRDLEVGILAQVQGLKGPDGVRTALRVAAGSLEDRPDMRALGQITAIGDRSFTLEDRQGRTLIFEVDETTRFRSRSGDVSSFGDLKVGMRVAVAGDQVAEGTYKAIVVGVGAAQSSPGSSPRAPLPGDTGE